MSRVRRGLIQWTPRGKSRSAHAVVSLVRVWLPIFNTDSWSVPVWFPVSQLLCASLVCFGYNGPTRKEMFSQICFQVKGPRSIKRPLLDALLKCKPQKSDLLPYFDYKAVIHHLAGGFAVIWESWVSWGLCTQRFLTPHSIQYRSLQPTSPCLSYYLKSR